MENLDLKYNDKLDYVEYCEENKIDYHDILNLYEWLVQTNRTKQAEQLAKIIETVGTEQKIELLNENDIKDFRDWLLLTAKVVGYRHPDKLEKILNEAQQNNIAAVWITFLQIDEVYKLLKFIISTIIELNKINEL